MPRAPKQRTVVKPRTDLEKPTHPVSRGRLYAQTQLVDPFHKRRAHDDRIEPVKVYKPSADGKRTGLGGHWDSKGGMEKPLLPLYAERDKYAELAVGFLPAAVSGTATGPGIKKKKGKKERSAENELPAAASLCNLPFELQDMILRHLLLRPRDIGLFKGWTLLYPHSRPRLSGLGVLYTCRSLHDPGADILYGEKKFLYEIRDPAVTDKHAARIVSQNVYANCVFPFKRYGSRIRFVRIGIDTGRVGMEQTRHAFIAALEKFLPENGAPQGVGGGRGIHTLTIELPAVVEQRGLTSPPTEALREADIPIGCFFRQDLHIAEIIKKLQPSFLQLRIPTGSPGDGSSTAQHYYTSSVDLRGCFTNLVGGGVGLLPASSSSTDDPHQNRIRKFNGAVANISFRIFCLISDPHSALSKALWVMTREEKLETQIALTRDDDDEHLFDMAKQVEPVLHATRIPQQCSWRLREREKYRRRLNVVVRQWLAAHQSYSDLEHSVPPFQHKSRDRYVRAQTEGPRTITSVEAHDALMKHSDPPRRRVHDSSSGSLRYHTLDREPGLAKFSIRTVKEMTLLGRELYHLGELKVDMTAPLRIDRGHLRASNGKTARQIRGQIQKFHSRRKVVEESG